MPEVVDTRWHGWAPCPAPPATAGGGPWLELSHVLRDDLSRVAAFPAARFERLYAMPRDPMNATTLSMVCHYGAHVDAPCHFIPGAPAFDETPLERLHGPGVVWRVESTPGGLIDGAQLAHCTPAMRPGDIVLLDADWARRFGPVPTQSKKCS